MSNYAKALGVRLREIRHQQGLSLQAVEEKSGRRWKAVVVGSYERGDRAITVQKLADLAAFYGIPVTELLPEARSFRSGDADIKVILDLERLGQLPAEDAGPLARFTATIQSHRGDYNGRVLSIRSDDLRCLAVLYDISAGELTDQLIAWGVLMTDARPVLESLSA